jgi:hypothetical protein
MAVALQEGGGERERERERERDTYHPYICAEASMRRHTTGGTFLGGGGREHHVFGMNRQELENDCEGDNEGSRRPPRGSSTVGSCASPEPDHAYNVCGFAQMEAGPISSPHQDVACAARPPPFQQTKKNVPPQAAHAHRHSHPRIGQGGGPYLVLACCRLLLSPHSQPNIEKRV